MEETEKIMYSEVYYILNMLGEDYINKLPQKLYEYIKKNRELKDVDYIDKTKDIAEQVQSDTITFIVYLNLEYWCDESEKIRLLEIYKNNDIIDENNKKEKYSVDNIFSNNITKVEENKETTALVEYKEQNWFKKTFLKIIKIINEILNKEK